MSVYAVGIVKDEADVIEGTLRHLASEGIDGIVVADNLSTDATNEILYRVADDLPCPVEVLEDHEVGYYQSRKVTALAYVAADCGADWIVPFDADELWYAPLPLAEFLAGVPDDIAAVEARVFNHLRTAEDVAVVDPFLSMVWRDRYHLGLPKVAVRWRPGTVIRAGNHGVDWPDRHGPSRSIDGLEVRHFPARSAEQFRRKALNGAAAYAATEGLDAGLGQHWRDYGALADAKGPDVLDAVFREHWYYDNPSDAELVADQAPYRRWDA